MNRKELHLLVIVALIAGLIGGVVSSTLFQPRLVTAQDGSSKYNLIETEEVVAERFLVKSQRGELLGMLAALPGGNAVTLALYDGEAEQARRLALVVGNDGISIRLGRDMEKQNQIVLRMTEDGIPFFGLGGNRGKEKVALTTGPKGVPILEFHDLQGRVRSRMGSPGLVTFNKDGKRIGMAP